MTNTNSFVRSICHVLCLFFVFTSAFSFSAGFCHTQEASRESQELYPSALARLVYEKANSIFENAQKVHYRHVSKRASDQVFMDNQGCLVVDSDCSGFISYVLHSVAPRQYKAVWLSQSLAHPKAKAYAEFFADLSTKEVQDGWLGLYSYRQLKRGDLIAWASPQAGRSGHIMLVDRPASEVKEITVDGDNYHYVDVYVLDDSSVYHFGPEELPPNAGQTHRNGLGKGYIRLVLDDDGRAIGYWEGYYWGEGGKDITHPKFSKLVSFARLVDEE